MLTQIVEIVFKRRQAEGKKLSVEEKDPDKN